MSLVELTNNYVQQLVDEINEDFPIMYILDTYKNLLMLQKYEENPYTERIELAERIMCNYLVRKTK